VLIALGGGVHVFAVARRLVAAIREQCPGARIRIAPGFSRRRRPAVPGARWLTPGGLIGPLATCDVAVLAGGVTLYEACALGAPIVCVAVVRGQRPAIKAFARRGAVLDAGGPGALGVTVGRAAAGVARLLHDRPAGRRAASAARRLVDGDGAGRVARRIRALVREREDARA
jgi:hypothetical protein